MERLVRHFQEELAALQERLLTMGGLAEARVRNIAAYNRLTEEEIKKLENVQATAVDGNPIHHLQHGPQ